MDFAAIFPWMKRGRKITHQAFKGYWMWDPDNKTIIMVTKDNQHIDFRDTDDLDFTLGFLLGPYWEIYYGPEDPRENDHHDKFSSTKMIHRAWNCGVEWSGANLVTPKPFIHFTQDDALTVRNRIMGKLDELREQELTGVSHEEILENFQKFSSEEIYRYLENVVQPPKYDVNMEVTRFRDRLASQMHDLSIQNRQALCQKDVTIFDAIKILEPASFADDIRKTMNRAIQ